MSLNPAAPLTSPDTQAVIDPKRCRPGGASEEYRNTMWVAVTGPREEVSGDPAQKLAQTYYEGGTVRVHGPLPDGPGVEAPPEPGTVPANQAVGSMQSYQQRMAAVNVTRQSDNCVCFYLIRSLRG